MAGGYVICEYETVKENLPFFAKVMTDCRKGLIKKGLEDWSPLKFAGKTIAEIDTIQPDFQMSNEKGYLMSMPQGLSGMAPKAGEFGESPIMPQLFRSGTNSAPANTTLTTWEQWFGATGHQVIMSGANSANIYEDYKIGLVGLVFLDKAIRISEIKMQISDKKLPRVNIEEAMNYNKPAVVFEDWFLLDEETGFDLYAYVLSQGYQAIKLLGLQINRVPNKLQVTNTGAALV